MDTTDKQWNIQGFHSPEPSVEARTENEDGLSAVAGALICLGVIIGVGAIIMLIVLMRLVNIWVMECSHILVVQCNTQTNSEAILQQCMYACGGSIPSDKEGGGGGGHAYPEKSRGGLKKKIF